MGGLDGLLRLNGLVLVLPDEKIPIPVHTKRYILNVSILLKIENFTNIMYLFLLADFARNECALGITRVYIAPGKLFVTASLVCHLAIVRLDTPVNKETDAPRKSILRY